LTHIWHPYSQIKDYETMPPIIVDHGNGIWIYDIYGKVYIDSIS